MLSICWPRPNTRVFEDQAGYFLLTVLLQWLVYSAAVYLLLAISGKKRGDAAAFKEISRIPGP
jgi:hypothetical protein